MTGNHSFNTELASRIGLNSAIIFQHIHYWCAQNKKGGRNAIEYEYNDGSDGEAKKVTKVFFWTYNSVREYQETFPYLTYDQIRRCLEKLLKNGLIFSGVFNEVGYDRTKWYTVSPKGVKLLKECLEAGVEETSVPLDSASAGSVGNDNEGNFCEESPKNGGTAETELDAEEACDAAKSNRQDCQIDLAETTNRISKNRKSNCQKPQMDLPKTTNGFGADTRPIPNLNQDLKPNSNLLCTPAADAARRRAQAPSLDELKTFCAEENIKIDSEYFYNFYESVGWTVGARHVQNWKALVLAWAKNPRNKAEVKYYETPGETVFKTIKIKSGDVSQWK